MKQQQITSKRSVVVGLHKYTWLSIALLLSTAVLPVAQAQNTVNIENGGTTSSLLVSGNWSLGNTPTIANDAVFNGTPGTGIRTLSAGDLTVGSFNVTATTGTYSIRNETATATDSTLTLGGVGNLGNSVSWNTNDLLYAASGSTFQLLGNNGGGGSGVLKLALGQSGNFNAAGTANIFISAAISGNTFGITKTGTGTLTLQSYAVNTFNGGVTINAGTLVENFGSLSVTADLINNANALTFALAGGTLNLTGKSNTANSQAFNGTAFNSGAAVITVSRGGTGSFALSLGTITRSAGSAVNFTTGSNGSTITISANTALTGNGIINPFLTVGGASNAGNWGTLTSGGTIAAFTAYDGALPTSGANAANNYTLTANATTTLIASQSANTLKFATGTATLALGGNTMTLTSGGVLHTSSGAGIISGGILTAGASNELIVQHWGGGALTISGTITGSGGLVKAGSGALTLSGANNYGNTYLNAGTLVLGNGAALGTGSLTINGGGLTVNNGAFANNNNIVANASFTLAGGNTSNTGTGTFKIFQPITISGGGGNDAGNAEGVTISNVITDLNGLNTLNALDITWNINGASTTAMTLGGTITLRANQTLNAIGLGQVTSDFIIKGAIGDGGQNYGVTFANNGAPSPIGAFGRGPGVFLMGANTYTGNTVINSGAVVTLGKNGTVGSLSPSSAINNSGYFSFYRSNGIAQGTDFGTISGSGTIVQAGGGSTTFSAVNTYTGPTYITGGVLIIGSIANAGTTSTLGSYATPGAGGVFLQGGTLRYTGGNASTDRGFTVAANSTLDVNAAGASLTMGASSIGTAFTLTVTGGTGSILNLPTITFTGTSGGLAVNTPATLNFGTVTMPANFSLTLGGTGTGTYPFAMNLGTATLTKSGAGTWTLSSPSTMGNLTVGNAAAGGTLVVASTGSLSVGSGSGNNLYVGYSGGTGTLDTSAATSFTANVAIFGVGYGPGNSSVGTAQLGLNSTITASTGFLVGYASNGSLPETGTVTAISGSTTTIHTPLMAIGGNQKVMDGTFTLLGTGATLNLDGLSGGRAQLILGQNGGNDGAGRTCTGKMDLSTGIANLTLSQLIIGQQTNTGGATDNGYGTLLLSSNPANHLDISGPGNVVIVGYTAGSNAGYTGQGTLTIGNLGTNSTITSTDNSTAILIGYRGNASGHTSTGTLTLSSGTLTITTTGSAIGTGGSGGKSVLNLGTTTGSGVTLIAGASSTTWIQNLTTATFAGAVTFNAGTFDLTIPQLFSGTGSLTKEGSGTMVLNIANSYSGGTTVNGGTLSFSGSGTHSGAIALATGTSTFNYNSALSQTLSGTISGSGPVYLQSGSGTLTLSGDSSYNGGTTIAGGTLVAGNNNALGSGQVTLSGGILAFGGSWTLPNPVDLFSSGTIDTGASSGTLGGTITGGTALTKIGTGDLILSGNNAYTSDTIISSGNLKVNNGNAIPDTGRVVLSAVNAALFTLSQSETIGSLEGGTYTMANGVDLTGNTLTTGGNNLDTTFAGILADAVGGGTITKTGTGTWTLIGDSTGFTWTMDVAAGRVINNGTFDSSTTVNVTGGTLGGTGTVGAVTLSPNGYLSPGNSPGVMTMGSLDLSGGVTNGALQFELDTPATSDRIDVAGALNIGSGLLGFTNFQFTALGGLTNDVYTLITSGGLLLGSSLNPSDLSGLVGVYTGTLSTDGSNIFLTLAIPEPSTWVLVGIALLPLMLRRRRKA